MSQDTTGKMHMLLVSGSFPQWLPNQNIMSVDRRATNTGPAFCHADANESWFCLVYISAVATKKLALLVYFFISTFGWID